MFGKNKLKPAWKFSQKGNLWKFIFAGNKYIAGETRDIQAKKLYLFVIRVEDGKKILSDFEFDGGNYWISLDAANEDTLYLSRFENPELPYPKNIIALDLETGDIKWENQDYVLHFCTDEAVYGLKRKYDTVEYALLNPETGSVINIIPEKDNLLVQDLKAKSDDDLSSEFYDYPRPVSVHPPEPAAADLIMSETEGKTDGNAVEYITRRGKLFFNYYVKTAPDIKDITRDYFRNIFCIYDIEKKSRIFSEILNEKSTYSVPDNFFAKGDYVYYLVEKKELKALRI